MDFQEQGGQHGLFETVKRLKTAFRKYWYLSFPPAVAVTVLVLALSIRLPDYFTSSFIIYIQPQQITTNLIGERHKDEQSERFDALIKELVSRPRVLSIIQRFNLYPGEKGLKGQERALKRFRNAYSIESVASVFGQNPNISPTFKVTFSHRDPIKTFQVMEELQNLFIEESLVSQASETRGTEEFFTSQLKSIQKKLEEIENKRQEYVRVNADRLPERREKAIFQLRDAQSKISANSQLIMANESRIRYLGQELQMTVRDPQTGPQSTSALDVANTSGASLSQLKRSLEILLGRYSEKHPDVIALKKRIEILEKSGTGKESASSNQGTFENTREARMIRREISELQVQTELLKSETEALKKDAEVLEREIESIPVKEYALIQIERDYATQKEIYDKLVLDREQAILRSNLIKSQRGSRFRIIEAPAKPQQPSGPPRELIAGGGILAGIMVFLMIPFSMYYLNSAFKFRNELEGALDLPVLGVIPPLRTPGVLSIARKAFATSVVTSLITVSAGVVLILFLL